MGYVDLEPLAELIFRPPVIGDPVMQSFWNLDSNAVATFDNVLSLVIQ